MWKLLIAAGFFFPVVTESSTVSVDEKVWVAMQHLVELSRMDLVVGEVAWPHPTRRTSSAVAATVIACSPPRAWRHEAQVKVRGWGHLRGAWSGRAGRRVGGEDGEGLRGMSGDMAGLEIGRGEEGARRVVASGSEG
ncbi:hypothetical protein NDU88_007395 [Pleurodeles waltl]|uniref:Secreted protein n=1 Tax=Pleurodeles waltl TaxID=8319 RepID=A0AAV7QRS3_PLEWA|nr:hypothetical protein NDU88_007395 [Pleurodeles waltl]